MPGKVKYGEDQKVSSIYDMDMFQGLEKNEKRRIVLMEPDPVGAVVHWVDGLGYVECLGDPDVTGKGTRDSEGCPACKYATEGKGVPVGLPRRQFITHILEYVTNSKGVPIAPISFKVRGWKFGNDKFNRLSDLVDNLVEGDDIRKKDLLVKCVEKNFQKFDIDVSGKRCLWLSDPEVKARAIALYKEERRSDIGKLLCKSLSKEELLKAVNKALPQARGGTADDAEEFLVEEEVELVASDVDVDDLLADDESEAEATPEKKTNKGSTKTKKAKVEDDVLGDLEEDGGKEEGEIAETEETDFDKILEDL